MTYDQFKGAEFAMSMNLRAMVDRFWTVAQVLPASRGGLKNDNPKATFFMDNMTKALA
jgi:hypothetical protein